MSPSFRGTTPRLPQLTSHTFKVTVEQLLITQCSLLSFLLILHSCTFAFPSECSRASHHSVTATLQSLLFLLSSLSPCVQRTDWSSTVLARCRSWLWRACESCSLTVLFQKCLVYEMSKMTPSQRPQSRLVDCLVLSDQKSETHKYNIKQRKSANPLFIFLTLVPIY